MWTSVVRAPEGEGFFASEYSMCFEFIFLQQFFLGSVRVGKFSVLCSLLLSTCNRPTLCPLLSMIWCGHSIIQSSFQKGMAPGGKSLFGHIRFSTVSSLLCRHFPYASNLYWNTLKCGKLSVLWDLLLSLCNRPTSCPGQVLVIELSREKLYLDGYGSWREQSVWRCPF